MSEIKLCYSFSARVDKLGFIDLLHSLHSARNYFDKEDITVFFTPPFNDNYEQQINKHATVIKIDHYSIPHPTYDPNDPTPPFYWDKYYFCDVNCENLIFLDNDTELQCDIREYFDKYDFDIMVLGDDGRGNLEFINTWRKTWTRLNAPIKPVLMTTVILFKHGTHKKIKRELHDIADKYMNGNFTFPAEDRLFDEYVFSLATRDYNVVIRPKNKDMVWTTVATEIARRNNPILHGGARKLFSIGVTPTEEEIFSKDLLSLIKQSVPLKHWIERVGATFLTMLEEDHPNFNVYFTLEDNTIVMHTNVELLQKTISLIYSYVWANKPKKYEFAVKSDL